MSFNVITSKISTPEREPYWAFVYSFESKNITKTRGVLHLTVSGKSNAMHMGNLEYKKDILSIVFNCYYKGENKSVFNALKQAAEAIHAKSDKEKSEISFSATSVVGDTVYSACFGGGQVNIYRNKLLSQILVSDEDVISASGFPKENDILILTNKSFFEAVSYETVRSALSRGALGEKTQEEIREIIDESDELNPVGYLLQFTKEGGLSKTIGQIGIERDDIGEAGAVINTSSLESKMKSPLSILSLRNALRNITRKGFKEKITSDTTQLDISENRRFGKKTTRSIGFLLLIMLVVSIGFGIYQNDKQEKINLYLPTLTEAEKKLDESETLYLLSPSRARELFLESKSIVDDLVSNGIKDERLDNLASRIIENEGKILGEYRMESNNFLDLTLQSSGFSGEDISVSDGVFYVLDSDGEKIVSVAVENKKSAVVAGPGALRSPRVIASYSDRVYAQTEEGIVRVDQGKDIVIDEKYADSLIFAYAANLYLVDKSSSKIIRFSAFEGGFGEASSWLSDGSEPDLSRINSFVIDGNLWMVSATGRVFKFTQGNQVDFSVQGLFPELTNPTQIYTDEEISNIYILEPSKNRIAVISKEGEFVAQYLSDELKSAIDFGVSEKDKKIIFLTGEKLMSIDLKHL